MVAVAITSDITKVLSQSPGMLSEGAESVVAFLRGRQHPAGGFADRQGQADLRQTMCGIECMQALRADLPVNAIEHYLNHEAARHELGLMDIAALVRAAADMNHQLDGETVKRLEAQIARCRCDDGGYALEPGAANGSMHGCFTAVCAYDDLGDTWPDRPGLVDCIQSLRTGDGGYADEQGQFAGETMTTAMAVVILDALGETVDPGVGAWLLKRGRADGGFAAHAAAPYPDLRVTSAALHALNVLNVRLGGLREPCVDFVESLWSSRGGFFGSWTDTDMDCRTTFDAMFSLGYLSQ
jgi:hypothetical protein